MEESENPLNLRELNSHHFESGDFNPAVTR